MKPEDGYQEACTLLKDRYGKSYRIATAYVERLTNGSPIRAEDSVALRRFSVLLTGCTNILGDTGYLSKAENPETLRIIVKRLPNGLKLKWRDIAGGITKIQKREITIKDLNDFVKAKARVATHAIFGNVSSHPPTPPSAMKEKKKPSPLRHASSYGTQARTDQVNREASNKRIQIICLLCDSNHWLSQCVNFKSKSLDERPKFVHSKDFYINCLVHGHAVSSRPKASFC